MINQKKQKKGQAPISEVMHAKGQLGLGQDFRHEGILGAVLAGRLLRETRALAPTWLGSAKAERATRRMP